jgi:hypothetical protein
MMRRRIISLAISLLMLSSGCEHSFNPKSVTHDEYVLQCFISSDPARSSSGVSALIARVYDVDGFDPSINTNDPSVVGATVTITRGGHQYVMKDSLRFTQDSLRYGSKQHSYYVRMPLPGPSEKLSISATLPDGRVLNAQTVAPRVRGFSTSVDFPQGITTKMNFPPGVQNWVISWDDGMASDPHLFFPQLVINYTKTNDSTEVPGTVVVPLKYINGASGPMPVYPTYTMETSLAFEFAAIDSAMASISAGDPDKSKYGVHTAWLNLMEYDTPLSKYYSSVHGSLDQFSIRVDQSVYSNVGGGIGIFGTYYLNQAQYFLDYGYVRSFGYIYR